MMMMMMMIVVVVIVMVAMMIIIILILIVITITTTTTSTTTTTTSTGTDLMNNMWFLQRDSNLWINPQKFDYSRFIGLPNNVKNYHPFSMGKCSVV